MKILQFFSFKIVTLWGCAVPGNYLGFPREGTMPYSVKSKANNAERGKSYASRCSLTPTPYPSPELNLSRLTGGVNTCQWGSRS